MTNRKKSSESLPGASPGLAIPASAPPAPRHPGTPVPVENVTTATFKCVFPVCGGICCKNGRPGLETYQAEKIEANLGKFLPHLRPTARKHVERHGWLTHRTKDGYRMIGVEGGWCLFANEGCVFQKVGMLEGDPWAYKPVDCVIFPLAKRDGQWFVRQWGLKNEEWDIFCLNPKEDPTPATHSLRDEIAYVTAREERMAREAATKEGHVSAAQPAVCGHASPGTTMHSKANARKR